MYVSSPFAHIKTIAINYETPSFAISSLVAYSHASDNFGGEELVRKDVTGNGVAVDLETETNRDSYLTIWFTASGTNADDILVINSLTITYEC